MKPDVRKGHVLLAQLVATGEVPVGLTMYNANIESLKKKGAPIDFVPVQPVIARPQGIGVAKDAPHPAAALLFVDFVLSPEGQKLYESMGRVPASTKVKSELNNFPFVMTDPNIVLKESQKWEACGTSSSSTNDGHGTFPPTGCRWSRSSSCSGSSTGSIRTISPPSTASRASTRSAGRACRAGRGCSSPRATAWW
jgi:hypothetical protein